MKFTEEQKLWVELAATPRLRPHHAKAIAAEFYQLTDFFKLDHMSMAQRFDIPADTALSLRRREGKSAASAELEWAEEHDIEVITFAQETYPSLLREIHDPPPVLFSRGALTGSLPAAVAIVGSRKCTSYGNQAAGALARDLTNAGFTIISGMAWGIDQAAHRGALEAGGATIAVIGSGLANIYPRGTDKLMAQICEQGAVTTEFFHSIRPDKGTFPQRNRIVAGICLATIVIEASERSGALITARLANEQGRDVMAVPGSIYSSQSKGSNWLIQQGAKLVRDVDDILEELPAVTLPKGQQDKQSGESGIALNESEQRIVAALSVDTPQHIDIIARQLGIDAATLSMNLLQLEINGIVRQLPGMKFVKSV